MTRPIHPIGRARPPRAAAPGARPPLHDVRPAYPLETTVRAIHRAVEPLALALAVWIILRAVLA